MDEFDVFLTAALEFRSLVVVVLVVVVVDDEEFAKVFYSVGFSDLDGTSVGADVVEDVEEVETTGDDGGLGLRVCFACGGNGAGVGIFELHAFEC